METSICSAVGILFTPAQALKGLLQDLILFLLNISVAKGTVEVEQPVGIVCLSRGSACEREPR